MSSLTIVFPDNAAGSHNAVVVTQLVEKLGGAVLPVGPEEAKLHAGLAAAQAAPPQGPGAALGAGGMLGLRPANLRTGPGGPPGAPPGA